MSHLDGNSKAAAVLERSAPLPASMHLEVHRDAAPILAAWADLEQHAACSIYQTRAFVLPWIATLGRKARLAPLFVLARGSDDRPLALLALGIIRRGPLRIAQWIGGSDANFNMALVRDDVEITGNDIARLLREAARLCGADRPDLFNLSNQPFAWGGRANPMSQLSHGASPSAAFGTSLPSNAEAFFAGRLSKDTRKKLRKKEAKLAELGPLTHLVVADAEAQRRVVDALLAHKIARFRERKIVSEFDSDEMRAFIESASAPNGAGIELHALVVVDGTPHGRIVAVYGGASHAGQWSGMFNAFDADEEIAKSSPGDLLLMRIITKACAAGLTRFDLGVGEARYKATFCDERIELFDAIVPVTSLGAVATRAVAARQTAKRIIKSDPRLFALAKRLRAMGR